MPLPPLLKNSVGENIAVNATQYIFELEMFTAVAGVKHKASMKTAPEVLTKFRKSNCALTWSGLNLFQMHFCL